MSAAAFPENGRPTGTGPGVYSLKWNSFQSHVTKGLSKLLEENSYTDVTLACDGSFLKAHKLLLSLCSPFFKRLFEVNEIEKCNRNTIVILNNVRFKDLENIIRFIYNGQTNVNQVDLHNFLETGELLKIEGLASCSANQSQNEINGSNSNPPILTPTTTTSQLPPLPTLQSYPIRSQVSTATSNSNVNMGANTTTMDSRLRASLTSTNTNSINSYHQMQNSSALKAAVGQKLPSTKRPRLSNTGQELIMSGSSSKLQSILTGQNYMPSTSSTKSNITQSPPERTSIIEKDPLEQDGDVINFNLEEDHGGIECEPMIEMDSVKSEPIQVYTLEDEKDAENGSEVEDDEFEDSQEETMDRTLNNQDIYQEHMEIARRNQLGPSTSKAATKDKQALTAAGIRGSEISPKSSSPKSLLGVSLPTNPFFKASLALRDLASSHSSGSNLVVNSNFSNLNDKMGNDEGINGKSSCEVCGLMFETIEMEDHLYKAHGRGSALCPYCNRYFKNKNSLKVHKSMYHRKPRLSSENETSSLFNVTLPEDQTEFASSTNSMLGLTFEEFRHFEQPNLQETNK